MIDLEFIIENGLEDMLSAVEQGCRRQGDLLDDGALSTYRSLLNTLEQLGMMEKVGEYQYRYIPGSLDAVTNAAKQELQRLRSYAAVGEALVQNRLIRFTTISSNNIAQARYALLGEDHLVIKSSDNPFACLGVAPPGVQSEQAER